MYPCGDTGGLRWEYVLRITMHVVKCDWNGMVCRNNHKKVGPVSVLWEPAVFQIGVGHRPLADKNWKWPILIEIPGQNGLFKFQTSAKMANGFNCISAPVQCPLFNAYIYFKISINKCSLEAIHVS